MRVLDVCYAGANAGAIAITNARLYERTSELSILAERNRLARDLHDAVVQKLFSLVLTCGPGGHAGLQRRHGHLSGR